MDTRLGYELDPLNLDLSQVFFLLNYLVYYQWLVVIVHLNATFLPPY